MADEVDFVIWDDGTTSMLLVTPESDKEWLHRYKMEHSSVYREEWERRNEVIETDSIN